MSYLYNYYISIADTILLTNIEKTFECDTYFPEIPVNFELTEYSSPFSENGIKYRHLIYTYKYASKVSIDQVYNNLLYNIRKLCPKNGL